MAIESEIRLSIKTHKFWNLSKLGLVVGANIVFVGDSFDDSMLVIPSLMSNDIDRFKEYFEPDQKNESDTSGQKNRISISQVNKKFES